VCSRCKLGIKKGEEALYYPASKTMLCAGQCCGRQEQADMDANRFDEAMYGGGYSARSFLVAIAAALIACQAAAGQTLPEAPKPHMDRTERVLLATDAASRALDVYSTHQILSCSCGHEMFLPREIADHPAAMGAVEALDVAAVGWMAHKLEQRHKPKLAHLLTMIDIGQDLPWAIHNLFLTKTTPVAQVLLPLKGRLK
jgi:hypothetical protein